MKEYKCDKCDKIFNNKNDYIRHSNRKNPCDSLIKNDNKNIINSEYIKTCLEKCICAYCNKKYSQKGYVMHHIKHNCKKVKEIEAQKQAIFTKLKEEKEQEDSKIKNLEKENKEIKKVVYELEKKLENELKKTQSIISNTINNNNTDNSINNSGNNSNNTDNSINNNIINNNNNQQIVLVDYNKEDLSKIDKKEILAIMKRGFQAPVELTRTIHCNPKYPEFHNVFIPKINEKME